MKSYYFLLIILALFVGGCANQVKNENRLEQEYKFGSIMYLNFEKEDLGNEDVFGKITFRKNSITVEMNVIGQVEKEEFSVKTVTFDNSPNELKYRTDKGDFTVTIENDSITEVTLHEDSSFYTFYKEKEIPSIKNKLPIEIGKPLKDWKRIEIKDIGTIDLSPMLEIQAGKYKIKNQEYKDSIENIEKVDILESKLTLQPKGINEYNETSLSKYCRVMVETIIGNPNDFQSLNEKIIVSSADLSELYNQFKSQIQQGFNNTTFKLIEWYPITISEINGMDCIHIRYKRQFKDQPHVMVDSYRFFNNDRIIFLTISYRISEKDYWTSTLEKTLNSFRITNIK